MSSGLQTLEKATNTLKGGLYPFLGIFGMGSLKTIVSTNTVDPLKSIHQLPDVSITAHSGFIGAFLTVVGRGSYSLPTGGVYPLQSSFPLLIVTRRRDPYRRQAHCILESDHEL